MARKESSPKKQASGGARLKASGKHPVLLGLTPEQVATFRAAADRDGRPLTQFFIYHAWVAAEKILKKASTST